MYCEEIKCKGGDARCPVQTPSSRLLSKNLEIKMYTTTILPIVLYGIMRFGTWNVRNLYRAGALGLVTSEIDRCRMDLVGAQEIMWEGSGTLESGNYTLFYGEGNANHQLRTGFFFIGELGQQSKRWNLSVTVFLLLHLRVKGVIL